MKQVLIKKGQAIVEEIPAPVVGGGEVLVLTNYSCISIGTEVSGLKEGGKSLVRRLIEQPENIKLGLKMAREQGIRRTMAVAQGVLESGYPTGYSAAGTVIETGDGINDIKVGDRVACAGAGIANHAEIISVPRNLLVKIPDGLPIDVASTVTLGSIALQGVRRADPQLGDYVAVIGLGILGQITAQLLKANGCKVAGVDLDRKRIDVAMTLGIEKGIDPGRDSVVDEIMRFSNGYGVDSVVITAATANSDVINEAMEICRKKGKIIIVGAVGMDLKRDDFYRKELDVLISTSYGPGRYDENYESKGHDYPYAYVRWTENRNMKAYLDLIREGKLDIKPLIEKIYMLDDAPKAYQEINSSDTKPLMVLLEYEHEPRMKRKIVMAAPVQSKDRINVALIGASSFAKGMHLPNLQKLKDYYTIYAIASRTGTNATAISRQYEATYATTDYHKVLEDKEVDMVLITTRHDLHAKMATEAARAGKSIFLEKPMALNKSELDELVATLEEMKVPFMVGFNRRFSPCARKIKSFVCNRSNPMIINYRMNAGYIPKEHWVHTEEGGGRNIGEACHIYDLFNFFTESEVASISAQSIDPVTEHYLRNDNFVATIKYKDGSVCNLIYTALGSKDVAKEQMDVYVDGKVIVMNDYKKLELHGVKEKGLEMKISEKGQYEEMEEFATSIKDGNGYPIPLWQMVQATEISFEVEQDLLK